MSFFSFLQDRIALTIQVLKHQLLSAACKETSLKLVVWLIQLMVVPVDGLEVETTFLGMSILYEKL